MDQGLVGVLGRALMAGVALLGGCDAGRPSNDDDGDTTGSTEATSSSSGTNLGIQCGSDSCDECCLAGTCDSAASCDAESDGVPVLFCDGPEDCGSGEACCAGLPAAAFPIRAECTAAAECSTLPEAIYFCHADEDCGSLGTCSPWDEAAYVSICI